MKKAKNEIKTNRVVVFCSAAAGAALVLRGDLLLEVRLRLGTLRLLRVGELLFRILGASGVVHDLGKVAAVAFLDKPNKLFFIIFFSYLKKLFHNF